MFFRCWLVLTAGLMLQAEMPLRELLYARLVRRPGEVVPLYDKGFLLFPYRPNHLDVLRPDGQPSSIIDVPCPSSVTCSVAGLAVNSAGSIALGLAFLTAKGRAAGIRLMDTSGRELRFVETGDYLPAALCFDAEDNLWSVGTDREPLTGATKPDFMLARKFSRDGKELGRYVPKSHWPAPKAQPGMFGNGFWSMKAASGRIGILVHENYADHPAEWVEWDLAGNLISRTLVKTGRAGRAYTSNGRFYAKFCLPETTKCELRLLDKKTGTWTAVPDNLPDTPEFDQAFLLGADGDDLVYSLDFRLVLVRPGDLH